MKDNAVSLCMVVRNAARRLEGLLPTMGTLVDEILVLDQSSEDDTTRVATKYGARVFSSTPKGYADPDRQYLYSLASHPWILAMDADETLNADLALRLKDMTADKTVDVFWFMFESYVEGIDIGDILPFDAHPRLWRKQLPDGQPTMIWPSQAHTFPQIRSNRVCYAEKARFIHDRTYEEILKSHESRTPVVHPQAQAQEQQFLEAIRQKMEQAGKAPPKDARPKEPDFTPRGMGMSP